MDWYIRCLTQKYADFDGRASRAEFWNFCLYNFLIGMGGGFVLSILAAISEALALVGFLLIMVYALGTLIPGIAVTVRRLHDTDRTGWLLLTPLIPFVGFIASIVLLVFYCQDSTFGRNQYGPNPKRPATV